MNWKRWSRLGAIVLALGTGGCFEEEIGAAFGESSEMGGRNGREAEPDPCMVESPVDDSCAEIEARCLAAALEWSEGDPDVAREQALECLALEAECNAARPSPEGDVESSCEDDVESCYALARRLDDEEEAMMLHERCIPLRVACEAESADTTDCREQVDACDRLVEELTVAGDPDAERVRRDRCIPLREMCLAEGDTRMEPPSEGGMACEEEVARCYAEARSLPEDQELALLFERCIPLREACYGHEEPPAPPGPTTADCWVEVAACYEHAWSLEDDDAVREVIELACFPRELDCAAADESEGERTP